MSIRTVGVTLIGTVPGPDLPILIIAKLKPIFAELSDASLLKKCLHGKTQNSNESFNRTIWDRIPKTTYVSLQQLEFGTYVARIPGQFFRLPSALLLGIDVKIWPGTTL